MAKGYMAVRKWLDPFTDHFQASGGLCFLKRLEFPSRKYNSECACQMVSDDACFQPCLFHNQKVCLRIEFRAGDKPLSPIPAPSFF